MSFHPGPAKNSPTPRKLILMPHLVNKGKGSRTRNASIKQGDRSNGGIMCGESKFLDYNSTSFDGVDSIARIIYADAILNSPSAAMPKINQKYINIDTSNLLT